MNAIVNWDIVMKAFKEIPRQDLIQNISSVVLQTRHDINADILDKYVDRQSREAYIQTAFIELMSTPEYQLC